MARNAQAGKEPRWNDVRAELLSVASCPLRPEVERLLLDILKFEGELQLDESSEMPHRMSPENMLKSLAVQALARWTGAHYLPTLRRIEATAPPALSTVIRAVIQKVGAATGRGKPRSAGFVAPPSEEPGRTISVVHDDILHESVDEWEQRCGYRGEVGTFLRDFDMTFMPEDRPVRQRQGA
jgi:hypothetical protein